MVPSEISSSDLSEYILFKIIFLSMKIYFFFKLLPKRRNFINSDDCIGKITPKSIRLNPVFIEKKLNLIKKRDYF